MVLLQLVWLKLQKETIVINIKNLLSQYNTEEERLHC